MYQGEIPRVNGKVMSAVIYVDEDKCLNCHKCIAACPVKYCNDGSEDVVHVNHDLCIGCGECLKACTHEARQIVDDFDEFMNAVLRKEKMVAIVAPAIASNFPELYLNFNGWLKSLGVQGIFDVSFGAELTVKSYLEYIQKNQPKMVIAQPCPALVTFVEIYHPELIPFLAPADSPMMHSIKQIKEFYPEFKNNKVVIISPCIAKKREFDEVGLGDYNVTMTKIQDYFEKKNVDLRQFAKVEFNNDPAERAVLFSSPGGLLKTAERELPNIVDVTRKIEGPSIIYDYLEGLIEQVKKGHNPLLIDCLNCELGCNGGTGTTNSDKHPDELERIVEERKKTMQQHYQSQNLSGRKSSKLKKIRKTVNKYWKPGLYDRKYVDRSEQNFIKPLNDGQIQTVYAQMHKNEDCDIKNCASCGYNRCEAMATAVYYNLNKAENCHFYIQDMNEQEVQRREKLINELNHEIEKISQSIEMIQSNISNLANQINDQFALVEETNVVVTQNMDDIKVIANKLQDHATEKLVKLTEHGGDKIKGLDTIMDDIYKIAQDMNSMIGIIDDISGKTNMLSINAAIQSAHAGEYGKAFAVVAKDIKVLAENTARNVDNISDSIIITTQRVNAAIVLSKEGGEAFDNIAEEVNFVDEYLREIENNMQNMSSASDQIISSLTHLGELSGSINSDSNEIKESVDKINESVTYLRKMSK